MAQTTDPLSMVDGDIEVAVASSGTWVNISGSGNSVAPETSTRATGVAFTFDGDTGVITMGKRQPFGVEVKGLYTETSGEFFETMRAWHQAGTRIDLRYSPKGIGATGRFVFTALNVPISEFDYPGGAADSADPIPARFKVMVPFLTKTTTASSTGLNS